MRITHDLFVEKQFLEVVWEHLSFDLPSVFKDELLSRETSSKTSKLQKDINVRGFTHASLTGCIRHACELYTALYGNT